ncbi:AraC family transcriptional regulator [Aquibacillus kalidii]|uniref:AraC family transcriptional regulator n=1 Tax=Aquibacillus kalidii TaxID=2762597 RepID=UPI00164614DF|nr:AraC family transcriptional regulator [Aquibacillus kalidii]
MNGIQHLSNCIDYIEARLDQEIDVDTLATIFCSSKFHFLRMFRMITGFTVAEYVRNRRLTLSAGEIITHDMKIIDVALKYGYETPESFSKAFRKLHGISPTQAKRKATNLKAFPPLSFQIKVKGEESMDYNIKETNSFQVIGKELRVTTRNGENFRRIPQFWDEFNNSETAKVLEKQIGLLGMLGICMEFAPDQEEFTYFIGVEKGGYHYSDGLVVKEIPKTTWAVFPVVGAMPDAIQETTKRIYSEWFPATGYKHAGSPEIEVYPDQKESIHSSNYRTEIWIPIAN